MCHRTCPVTEALRYSGVAAVTTSRRLSRVHHRYVLSVCGLALALALGISALTVMLGLLFPPDANADMVATFQGEYADAGAFVSQNVFASRAEIRRGMRELCEVASLPIVTIPVLEIIRLPDDHNTITEAFLVGWPLRCIGICSETHLLQSTSSARSKTPSSLAVLWKAVAVNVSTMSVLIASLWAIAIIVLRYRRRQHRRCTTCGYDVRLLDTSICPECGTGV